jgi:hypothetical protein
MSGALLLLCPRAGLHIGAGAGFLPHADNFAAPPSWRRRAGPAPGGHRSALPAALLAADDNPDAAFYKNAAEGGMAEVELGKLAQEKSPTQSVKDFGAMMVSDHGAANDKLKAIADRKNIKLPTTPVWDRWRRRQSLKY